MCLGREFQREGAAIEKALSPKVQCLVLSGGDRRLALEYYNSKAKSVCMELDTNKGFLEEDCPRGIHR